MTSGAPDRAKATKMPRSAFTPPGCGFTYVAEGGADVVESPPSLGGAEPVAGHLDDEGLEQALVPSAEQDAERACGPVPFGDDEVQQVRRDRGVGDGPLRPV